MHEQEKIVMDAFQMLNDEHFKELGVAQMGIRLKVNTALVLMSLAEARVGECVSHCCWMTASPAPS